MEFSLKFICILCIIINTECGDITVNYSPSSLRFGSADSLHSSEFDDLIATSLGYTPESLTWRGLTVTSAFKYPMAAVVFGIKTEGVSMKIEGVSYDLKEDISFYESFDSVSSLIAARAQRPINFEKLNVLDLLSNVESLSFPKSEFLDRQNAIDYLFLQEISLLPFITDFIKEKSSIANNGQDIIYVQVESLASLVKEYGAASPKVQEAIGLLRDALEQATYRLRSFYTDRVIIFDALISSENHIRRTREVVIGDVPSNTTKYYNLASEYSENFPVIFNIVLILSIILIVAIIAASHAMAFMDPGRDSIIYRMTNPRMKKDQ